MVWAIDWECLLNGHLYEPISNLSQFPSFVKTQPELQELERKIMKECTKDYFTTDYPKNLR